MERKLFEIFPGRDFGVVHDIDESPNTIEFQLHNHNDIYEIILLLHGDCEFYVEGNTYRLSPRDIIFTRPFELHKMRCLTERTYERIILYVTSNYFKQNQCEELLAIFHNRPLGTGNCIAGDAMDHALRQCVNRLDRYCANKAYTVAQHTVFECLYLLNQCKGLPDASYVTDERVRRIIVYINDHLADNLSLDTLSNEFFVAKNYLCKVFKQHTGYTVNRYINYKRILLAQELHRNGQSLLHASMNAGFNSYANFYKAYVKQTGRSPRADV